MQMSSSTCLRYNLTHEKICYAASVRACERRHDAIRRSSAGWYQAAYLVCSSQAIRGQDTLSLLRPSRPRRLHRRPRQGEGRAGDSPIGGIPPIVAKQGFAVDSVLGGFQNWAACRSLGPPLSKSPVRSAAQRWADGTGGQGWRNHCGAARCRPAVRRLGCVTSRSQRTAIHPPTPRVETCLRFSAGNLESGRQCCPG